MIRDHQPLEELDARLAARDSSTFEERLAMFDSLLALARMLQAIPTADPLAGLDVDIRVARIVNAFPSA